MGGELISMKRLRNSEVMVICGFPGVGKSEFYRKFKRKFKILDSDSSKFPKTNGQFPNNYVDHIEEIIKNHTVDIIMVSTHASVLDELESRGINHFIAYPTNSLRYEYMRRYMKRGNSFSFIKNIYENWYTFISGIEKRFGEPTVIPYPLYSNEYLSDLFTDKLR